MSKNQTTIIANTIIADNFISRSASSITNIFNNIIVKEKINTDTLISNNDVLLNSRLFVKDTAYITNKLFVGNNNTNYISGNVKGIGINTKNPLSTFHITSDVSNILTINTNSNTIRNIIGENINNKGIVTYSTDNFSELDFYNDTSSNSINIPDAKIRYETGGNLILKSKNIISTFDSGSGSMILNKDNTILNNIGNIQINSQNQCSINYIDSITNSIKNSLSLNNQGISLNSKNNIKINSINGIIFSKNNNNSKINDETITIYDTSNSSYLLNVYDNSNAYTGNTLSLVATDNNSNTQAKIITPNNMGLLFVGGVLPNDNTRSMGVISLSNTYNNNNVPSISIISGKNDISNNSTIGINTYSPKTEQYILDINGPTRISNGEINILTTVDFEIKFMKFSQNTKLGIAIGTQKKNTTVSGNTNYIHNILYSYDKGITWNETNTTGLSLFNNFNFTSLYVFNNNTINDTNFAILGGENDNLYYTFYDDNNNDISLNTLNYDTNTLSINTSITTKAIAISNSSTDSNSCNIVFVYYTTNQNICNAIIYKNILITNFKNIPYQFNSNNTTNINISGIQNQIINDCCIINNNIFFVGTGIYQYNTNGILIKTLNSINTYNNIFYNESITPKYVVAVGNNIITIIDILKDPITTNDYNPSNTKTIILNSIYIYDLSNAIIVGDNGIILYSKNWTTNTWINVPFNVLNSSGIGNTITNYNLKNIFLKDLDTFIIAKVNENYSSTNNGKSQILGCYIPSIFNNDKNNILDVSGNMQISGDININDSGKISTNNSNFSLLNNDNINNIFFGGNNTLTTIKNNVIITNDISINGNLLCNSISAVNNNDVNFFNNPNYNGNIFIGNNNNNIYINGFGYSLKNLLGDVSSNNSLLKNVLASLATYGITDISGSNISTTLYANKMNETNFILNYSSEKKEYTSGTSGLCFNPINSFQIRNVPSIYASDTSKNLTVVGAGIYIKDFSDGYILVSSDTSGYIFKAPGSENVVNLNVGNLKLPRNIPSQLNIKNTINNGILVLSNNNSKNSDSANYSIEVNPIDISNILLRDASSTNTYQQILTNIGLSGDLTVLLNKRLFVYGDASMSNNLYVRKNLFINNTTGINTFNTNYNLDISGTVNINGITNPITLVDNSILLTNTPPLDFSNNFCTNLINTNIKLNINTNGLIVMSANGMIQFISIGTNIYNSYNYGISWINNTLSGISNTNQIDSLSISSDGSIIFFGSKSDTNLYISDDYGNTWNKSKNFNGTTYFLSSFAISSNGKYVTALCYNTSSSSNILYRIFYLSDYNRDFDLVEDKIQQHNTSPILINKSIMSMSSSGQYQIICINNNNTTSTSYSNIYVSKNYGLNWSNIPNTSSQIYNGLNSVSMSSSGKYIIIGTSITNSLSPFYFSSNYGNTFNEYFPTIPYSPNNWNFTNISSNGQYIIGIDSSNNKIVTSVNYGNTWNYINTLYSIISSAISSNGQYITLIDSLGNIYYSITPYINMSISNNLIVSNDSFLFGRAFINSPVIQF
jgi:hypothetical protein